MKIVNMQKITENTLVPISILGVIVGGIFWLSNMYFQTKASADDIVEIKAFQLQYMKDTAQIREDMAVIKATLKEIKNGS